MMLSNEQPRDVVIRSGASAAILFHLLFSVYFLYNFIAAKFGQTIPLIGGGYAFYCALFMPVALLFIARKIPATAYRLPHVLFVGFVFSILVMVALGYIQGGIAEAAFIATKESLVLIIILVPVYFVGLCLPIKSRGFIASCGVALIMLSFLTIVSTLSRGGVSFTPIEPWGNQIAATSSYQGYARSIVALLFVAFCLTETMKYKAAFLGMGIVSLFFIGARSELYGAIIALLVPIAYWSVRSYKWLGFSALAAALLVCIVAANFDSVMQSRQMLVFTGLDGTTSWDAREAMTAAAVDRILQNPTLGDFGGYIDEVSIGGYAHNIISAWANYGIFVFAIYSLLLATTLGTSIKYFVASGGLDRGWTCCLVFSIYAAVLCLVSKSVFWEMPALSAGLVVNMLIRQRRVRAGCRPNNSPAASQPPLPPCHTDACAARQ